MTHFNHTITKIHIQKWFLPVRRGFCKWHNSVIPNPNGEGPLELLSDDTNLCVRRGLRVVRIKLRRLRASGCIGDGFAARALQLWLAARLRHSSQTSFDFTADDAIIDGGRLAMRRRKYSGQHDEATIRQIDDVRRGWRRTRCALRVTDIKATRNRSAAWSLQG